ncbi:hypothetical protein [Brevundimonas sp.]|uniref:hypothetical protein n=1 Tax=Brevundimonas sp. TaxID=1871086 RepID=UPI00248A535E|nr:hypothetical protein [Brevundimonas sp.]MDI1279862.1 hypothetical protein [Brevundimonas sp.]
MRLPLPLLLSGLALTAVACAPVAVPAPTLLASGYATAPVANYDWYLHVDGDDARLAYGLRDSDDLRLGLDCGRGSGRVAVSALGETGARPEINLESGGEAALYPATAEASELTDGVVLSASVPAAAPVFRRFQAVGWLAQRQADDIHAYVAHPGSQARITRFFAFCG